MRPWGLHPVGVTPLGGRSGLLSLTPSDGPEEPVASRPRSGLTSATSFRFDADAAHDFEVALVNIPFDAAARLITAGTVLRFSVFPEVPYARSPSASALGPDLDDVFSATRVAVDVVLDDGSRASDHEVIDQYGFVVRADDAQWAKSLIPGQWNSRVVDLSPLAGRSVVSLNCVVVLRRSGPVTGYLDGIRLGQALEPAPKSYADHVLTTRGTHSSPRASRGNTFPATAVPHGFMFVTPVTDARDDGWVYSYHARNVAPGTTPLQAVAVSHLASPWMRDHGVLQLLPSSAKPVLNVSRGDRALTFSHDNESARAHLYRVDTDQGIRIELAPTDHAALFEFTYPRGERYLSIDTLSKSGRLEFSADGRTFSGWVDSPARPRMYFLGRSDAAAVDSEMVADRGPAGVIRFADGQDTTLRIALATSFLSVEQAACALEQELDPDDTTRSVGERAREAWNGLLSRVTVDGASDDQLVTLYSNLYRIFLYPNSAAENVGSLAHPVIQHRDVASGLVAAGGISVNNGFWDTYRTAWPALNLLAPQRADQLLDGFLQHFRSTGWVPRWSAPGAFDCMVGTSSDMVLADAVVSRMPGFDPIEAFDSTLRNALSTPPGPSVGRADLDRIVFVGHAGTVVPESVSWTLENAINDYAISRMAAALAARYRDHHRHEEFETAAEYFGRRALGYRRLFDCETGFFRGRGVDGAFARADNFDPRRWGGDYAETNAWGMAFTAPHDGAGLAALHGGAAALEAKLDDFFATPETAADDLRGSYPHVIHEMTEARDTRMGMLGLSNQPAHHIPFMYLFTDSPHKTEAITRDALARLFLGSDIGQGYPGDEDNGEMSAWWLFCALGLYPLAPASGGFVITSPLFERMTLRLESGGVLTVTAREQSAKNVYIQNVTLDGRPWTGRFVPRSIIDRGANIEFRMGPRPAAWSDTKPPSLSDDAALTPLVDLTSLPGHPFSSEGDSRSVFDDTSVDGIRLPEGGCVRWDFDEPREVGLYTVTSAKGPPVAWLLEGVLADEPGVAPNEPSGERGWVTLDSRSGALFRWDRETRVFRTSGPRRPALRSIRLRARHPLDLRQLEFFTPTTHR